MKFIIKWILNHVPRRIIQRMATWAVPFLGLFYKGRGRECPICGSRYRNFMPYGYVKGRNNALCPSCLSLERHRMIWLWMERNTSLFKSHPRLLHIAPEPSLMNHFRESYGTSKDYITADLESPFADQHFDVQEIPLPSNSVDVIICNHLLEHVDNDRLAMQELYRIMRPGGWGIMLVPEDRTRATTFEDDSITDPEERTRLFGQYDHRRVYGRDYDDRLRDAGFDVERNDFARHLTEWEKRLYAPGEDDLVIVRKPHVESPTEEHALTNE
ncbi:MAG: class I SAM-dependent methyltransferase [Alistipes sp.]|nr:class I SAM-dependent methyltransferase [Alistipes sp.]